MRPMSEEVPALTGRTRLVVGVAVGLVVAAGLLLRFWTRSGLWLDEALTVNIARLPLHAIPGALKHDGAPPLYYYLLHFWMALFGQSNDAVRALSGLIAVATLPVAWLCGRRLGGRAVAWTMLVLLGQRALRGVLRHRIPHVRAGHPLDRLRLSRPGPGRHRPVRATSSRWPS